MAVVAISPWPPDWPAPTAALVAAVQEAAAELDVPEELLWGVARKESSLNPKLKGYKHGGNSPTFLASWQRNKDKRIPGSTKTWGDLFPTPESWRPYGTFQLLPYNVVGKTRGVPASKGLAGIYDVRAGARCAAQLLRELHDKYGSWDAALKAYNGSAAYARVVAAYVDELKAARAAA